MRQSNIAKKLEQVINDWADSIKDKAVSKLVRKDAIITGGSIASLFLGEDVNDYDIYLASMKAVKAVANYYTRDAKVRIRTLSSGEGVVVDFDEGEEEYFLKYKYEDEGGKYRPLFIS